MAAPKRLRIGKRNRIFSLRVTLEARRYGFFYLLLMVRLEETIEQQEQGLKEDPIGVIARFLYPIFALHCRKGRRAHR
jgi:hypothetical protein